LISSARIICAKIGPGWNLNSLVFALVHRHAEDIGGQQVAGELDALELQSQRARQHMCQRGLADPRQILDQQMAACQQTGKREADLLRLAEDDLLGLFDDVVQILAHIRSLNLGKAVVHERHEMGVSRHFAARWKLAKKYEIFKGLLAANG